MPYNIVFRYPDPLAKQMYLHTNKMAMVIARDIKIKKRTKRNVYPWSWLAMISLRLIIWKGAKLNGPLFRVRKDRCIQCGRCQAICPSNNIEFVDGYPKFSSDCSMCMGCVMYCPEAAIRPGLIAPLAVNGPYEFAKLIKNDAIPSDFINENTKGYFKSFRKYYRKTNALISQLTLKEESKI